VCVAQTLARSVLLYSCIWTVMTSPFTFISLQYWAQCLSFNQELGILGFRGVSEVQVVWDMMLCR
jgi:hypothetical protein